MDSKQNSTLQSIDFELNFHKEEHFDDFPNPLSIMS